MRGKTSDNPVGTTDKYQLFAHRQAVRTNEKISLNVDQKISCFCQHNYFSVEYLLGVPKLSVPFCMAVHIIFIAFHSEVNFNVKLTYDSDKTKVAICMPYSHYV